MNGKCPRCQQVFNVRVRRGDRISNHCCPGCGDVPLQGVTAGAGHGRYLCPITGLVVTLGQTGVRLEQPYRLVFETGVQWPHGSMAGICLPFTVDSFRVKDQAVRDRVRLPQSPPSGSSRKGVQNGGSVLRALSAAHGSPAASVSGLLLPVRGALVDLRVA